MERGTRGGRYGCCDGWEWFPWAIAAPVGCRRATLRSGGHEDRTQACAMVRRWSAVLENRSGAGESTIGRTRWVGIFPMSYGRMVSSPGRFQRAGDRDMGREGPARWRCRWILTSLTWPGLGAVATGVGRAKRTGYSQCPQGSRRGRWDAAGRRGGREERRPQDCAMVRRWLFDFFGSGSCWAEASVWDHVHDLEHGRARTRRSFAQGGMLRT